MVLGTRRPLLIQIAALWTGFLGVCWVGFLLASILGLPGHALLGGDWIIPAEAAFALRSLPLHLPFAFAAVVSVGLWQAEAWARHLAAALWFVFAAAGVYAGTSSFMEATNAALIPALCTIAYLHLVPAVRIYFDRLEDEERDRADQQGATYVLLLRGHAARPNNGLHGMEGGP